MGIKHVYICDWCQKEVTDHGEQNSMQEVKLTTERMNYKPTIQHLFYRGLWCLSCLKENSLYDQYTPPKKLDEPEPPTIEDTLRRLLKEVAEQVFDERENG